ncbi:GGDEF domain-containing protein [Neiella sp. HB171785]|uniref:diguanylate cyclase n=1 Tax=Neiella litorisoli TaxID=2771431 RepID=A0A8J6QSK3_9GAMM|nr:GGDEF domain-containing protein [Neiella litorisoli]MBD1387847.1 GGDEF domain-containing protein [Neiella litorisoli]
MPISYEFFPQQRLFVTKYSGSLSDQELLATYQTIYNHPDMRPGYKELALMDQGWQCDVTEQGLIGLAQASNDFHQPCPQGTKAAVVFSTLSQELLSDFYSLIARLQEAATEAVEAFPTVAQALEYLGIDQQALAPDVYQHSAGKTGPASSISTLKCLHELVDDKTAALQHKVDQLTIVASTDPLTRLANRHKIDETINQELERLARHQRPCCLALIDVDDFKTINDSFGHNVGDEALIAIAGVLKESLRSLDVAGRWGGDEFLLVLPETKLAGAALLMERVRHRMTQLQLSIGQPLSISIGLCEASPEVTKQQLFQRMDRALYRAKQSGKDRLEAC